MNGKRKVSAAVLWTLFRTCFVISSCTFGGGMVIISMLQKKFVEELKWIGESEVMELVAIAQSCPGVMAVNTSIIIGYRVAGIPGALLTAFGTVLPPMIILTVVSKFYIQFRSNVLISLILRGMQAGVAAVILSLAVTFVQNILSKKEALGTVMLIAASVAVIFFDADIIIVLLCCGTLSAALALCEKRRDRTAGTGGAE